jgi:hypothetical protein
MPMGYVYGLPSVLGRRGRDGECGVTSIRKVALLDQPWRKGGIHWSRWRRLQMRERLNVFRRRRNGGWPQPKGGEVNVNGLVVQNIRRARIGFSEIFRNIRLRYRIHIVIIENEPRSHSFDDGDVMSMMGSATISRLEVLGRNHHK